MRWMGYLLLLAVLLHWPVPVAAHAMPVDAMGAVYEGGWDERSIQYRAGEASVAALTPFGLRQEKRLLGVPRQLEKPATTQYMLGLLLLILRGYDDAEPYLREAADQGHAGAQYWVGRMHDWGWAKSLRASEGGEPTPSAASASHCRADQGNGERDILAIFAEDFANSRYGHAIVDAGWGEDVPLTQGSGDTTSPLASLYDAVEAARWYRQAAEGGHPGAQYNLALLHDRGEIVRFDLAEAARLYRKAAVQGNPAALYSLGVMHERCELSPAESPEASHDWMHIYRTAVEPGCIGSYCGQGGAHDSCRDSADYVEAARMYRMAADRGHAAAQFNLAVMYVVGAGVPRVPAEAARRYRLAAKQGHPKAQYNLGVLYAHGYGVDQDMDEAARLFRQAAQQGHAGARYSLGVMHAVGAGVSRNVAEAARLFRLAARQGHPGARHNLGVLYAQGEVAGQDGGKAARPFHQDRAQGMDSHEGAAELRVHLTHDPRRDHCREGAMNQPKWRPAR